MSKAECPYCEKEQVICHDDGEGYEDGIAYNQQCESCGKYFVYYTCIHFSYDTQKADCLNDGEHEWEITKTYPKKYSQMCCKNCDERRDLTDEEVLRYKINEVDK